MTDATLMTGGRPAVRLERHLTDPPEVVWRDLTERARLARWFPCDVVVGGGEWVVGAAITFAFAPEVIEMTLEGAVLVVEQPSRLSFTWGDEVLRFELYAEGSATLLVLYDEMAPGNAARNAAGWDECLDRLVGVEPSSDTWRSRFSRYSAEFRPFLGPQDGPPSGYKGDHS